VVVLFPGALGDLVLVMPTLVRLRARHADAHVTLAVSGWLQALAASSGVADATVSLDAADATGLFGGDRLPSWMHGHPVVYAWIGLRDPVVRRRLRALASRFHLAGVVRDDGPEHAAAAYARQAGVPDPEPFSWPPVPAGDAETRPGRELRRPLLAVHAGAGSTAKRWARSGYAEVAARWRAAGGDVVEVVGPADHDLVPLDVPRIVERPLSELVALLACVDAYVGNDSGVTHLAAAAGATGVAIYGPTAASRWSPFGGRLRSIQAAEPYDDAGITTAAISVDRVWRALSRRALASHRPR
jgi:ADP-heptose:LPS heptosyltransferase